MANLFDMRKWMVAELSLLAYHRDRRWKWQPVRIVWSDGTESTVVWASGCGSAVEVRVVWNPRLTGVSVEVVSRWLRRFVLPDVLKRALT